MQRYKTVLGDIPESAVGITLCHEHVCCYSEYLYQMSQGKYLDKEELISISANYLRRLKAQYDLTTFIDCTPLNIGRDLAVLKEVSRKSGVNITCSTGFYYTEETLLCNPSAETITEYIVCDARNGNSGLIKCATENEQLSVFDQKILKASAVAQRMLGIPIVEEEYIANKVNSVRFLFESGYGDRVLLSHDDAFFNGFVAKPEINPKPRFSYCFDHILPKFHESIVQKIMIKNPIKMLKCGD